MAVVHLLLPARLVDPERLDEGDSHLFVDDHVLEPISQGQEQGVEPGVVEYDDPHTAAGLRRRALGQAEPLPRRVVQSWTVLFRRRIGEAYTPAGRPAGEGDQKTVRQVVRVLATFSYSLREPSVTHGRWPSAPRDASRNSLGARYPRLL